MPRGRAAKVGRWLRKAPGKMGGAIIRGASSVGRALRVHGYSDKYTDNAPGDGEGGEGGGGGGGDPPTPDQDHIDASLDALKNTPATFLQHNVVRTAGQVHNGQVATDFRPAPGRHPGTQEMLGGKHVWLLQRPSPDHPDGNTTAYNFKLNPMKDVLDTDDSFKEDPEFLTISAGTHDGLVYTGQLSGCTIAAITMPDGSVRLVHLQPRRSNERPNLNLPADMSAQAKRDAMRNAENLAMQKVVNDYMASVGGTRADFYQSGADTPTTYTVEQLRGVYISGHVKDGVLHMFAQEVPLDGTQPSQVKEIFNIPVRAPTP